MAFLFAMVLFSFATLASWALAHGEDADTSVWRAYYDSNDDPTNNAVTSTISVDSQGDVLNEVYKAFCEYQILQQVNTVPEHNEFHVMAIDDT